MQIKASLLVALSGILYGFMGYLGTLLVHTNMPLSSVLFWRFFIAGIVMLIFVGYKSKNTGLPSTRKSTLLWMFLAGAIAYGSSTGLYFMASRYIGTGLAMVIFFSYPLMIAIYAWFAAKKVNPKTLLALITMIVGLLLLRDSSSDTLSLLGVILGIASAACYALYLMGSKRFATQDMDPNMLTVLVCFGGAFIFLVLSLLSHQFVFPHNAQNWAIAVVFGVFITALPIQLMLVGLKYITSLRASIISVLEPLVTVIVGVALLHESVSHIQMLGAFIILTSALFVQFQKEL